MFRLYKYFVQIFECFCSKNGIFFKIFAKSKQLFYLKILINLSLNPIKFWKLKASKRTHMQCFSPKLHDFFNFFPSAAGGGGGGGWGGGGVGSYNEKK